MLCERSAANAIFNKFTTLKKARRLINETFENRDLMLHRDQLATYIYNLWDLNSSIVTHL